MSRENFDDAPQWYWAAADHRTKPDGGLDIDNELAGAGDRFVIASGQRELWSRVRAEIISSERCSWHGFGPKDGKATLADCFQIFITGREHYGANYNRVVFELAKVPAFAEFIRTRNSDLGNWVSNPMSVQPLPRERYSAEAAEHLGRAVAATLNIDPDWWR